MWGLWRAPAAAGPCSLNMDQGGGLRDPSFSRWLGKQGPPSPGSPNRLLAGWDQNLRGGLALAWGKFRQIWSSRTGCPGLSRSRAQRSCWQESNCFLFQKSPCVLLLPPPRSHMWQWKEHRLKPDSLLSPPSCVTLGKLLSLRASPLPLADPRIVLSLCKTDYEEGSSWSNAQHTLGFSGIHVL